VGDLAPQAGAPGRTRVELDCPLQEDDLFFEGVARSGEFGCATQPRQRLRAERLELRLLARPYQVDIFRPDRLGEVMSEQRGMLVTPSAVLLDPVGESGVQPASPRLGQAGVGHLTCQCVLEAELALACQH
jgi:hypothetical protein